MEKEQATREKEQQEALLAGASRTGAPAHFENTPHIPDVSDELLVPLHFEKALPDGKYTTHPCSMLYQL